MGPAEKPAEKPVVNPLKGFEIKVSGLQRTEPQQPTNDAGESELRPHD